MATTHSTSSVDIATLRHAVRGSVLAPGDDGWDEARTPWNVQFQQNPALVVVPANSADVQAVVRFATANGLRVAPQGTGHGVGSLGDISDAILVRMTDSPTSRSTSRPSRPAPGPASSGRTSSTPRPSTASWPCTARRRMSASPATRSAAAWAGWPASTASPRTPSRRSRSSRPTASSTASITPTSRDLFFALRGGGGNFGIVTAIEFKLFPMTEAFAGWMIWPWEEAGRVLAAWRDWTETTPDEVTSVGRLFQFPPAEFIPEPLRGRNLVVVEVAYMGDEAAGRELLAPLLDLEPEMSTLATIPAAGLVRLHADPEGRTPAIGDGSLLTELPDEAIASFLDVAGAGSGSPFISVELRQLGGALARPAAGAGAASHLEGKFQLFSVGLPFTPEMAQAIESHLDVVDDAMAPWKSRHTYFNLAERPVDSASLYAGSTHDRLREIRERFDPAELFRSNHRIQPAGADW